MTDNAYQIPLFFEQWIRWTLVINVNVYIFEIVVVQGLEFELDL